MNNFIKFVSVLAILAIGLSCSYYFAYLLPKETKEKEIYRRSIDCREMAEKRFQQESKEIDRLNQAATEDMISFIRYENYYDKKLNRCIYCSTQTFADFKSITEIYDLYTNQQLRTFHGLPPEEESESMMRNREQFEKFKNEILGKTV